MGPSETLPIYVEAYQLAREAYQMTHKFPKEYKYCLGDQINQDVLKLLYFIFQANHIKAQRLEYIRSFLAALDMVRVEFRLAHDMKALSTRQMAHLAQFLDKIVRQATAWQKYQQSQERKEIKDSPELNQMDKPSV